MAIIKVQKRNGAIVDFTPTEISDAIYQAAKAVGGHDKEMALALAKKVIATLHSSFDGTIPSI